MGLLYVPRHEGPIKNQPFMGNPDSNPPGEDLQILLQLRRISQWPGTVFLAR